MAQDAVELLQQGLRSLGISLAEANRRFRWTERIGCAESTLRSHFNGTRGLSLNKKAAEIYANDLGLSRNALLGLDGGDTPAGSVPVEGRAKWGEWRDTQLFSNVVQLKRPGRAIDVPRGLGRDMRRAVVVEDSSVNRVIAEGGFAIYEPIEPAEAIDLTNGYVYILRRRESLETREIRKIIGTKDDKLILGADSTNPRYAGTITYPSSNPTEVVEIIGKVVGQYGSL